MRGNIRRVFYPPPPPTTTKQMGLQYGPAFRLLTDVYAMPDQPPAAASS